MWASKRLGRRVKGRQPVGRRQHDDLPPRVEAVEQHVDAPTDLSVGHQSGNMGDTTIDLMWITLK